MQLFILKERVVSRLSMSVFGEFLASMPEYEVLPFESDKVRALLAYLVVEKGRAHRRDALVGLLWPDCSEQTARHNLSQALFSLRKVLGDLTSNQPYLQTTRETIQFNSDSDYSLDLDQFNLRYSAWENAQGQEDAPVALLDEMSKLYRGDFLEGFSLKDSAEFDEWILVQRAALHQRAVHVMTVLTNEQEKIGDFRTAQRSCLRQLELDPWNEDAHCQLMRLLALQGQRAAALAQYEICRNTLSEELGVDPSPKTRELYEQIRLGAIQPRSEAAPTLPAAPHARLPLPLTPFLGRSKELSELDRMIADPECRCISLVGPGGIGKTRLALEAAKRNINGVAHGAAFISLVSVDSVEAAVSAIASGIGFDFHGPTDPKAQLLSYLENKQMLLVLDNMEHLLVEEASLGSITDLIIAILEKSPQVKIIATSREALNIREEWIFEVEGLDYPTADTLETAEECSAIGLFVQHARKVRPGFKMSAGSQESVSHLCRLVEGMPLAIELAAAWARILPVEEILAEVERSLDFLNTQMRGISERHRSMRAVFDQSWQMLSFDEKQALCKLSVFRGGFTRQAAEQVAGASLLVLSSLVIRSLVRRTEAGRYDIHELIRQYAASKLADNPVERTRVQDLHSLYFLSLLEKKDALLHSPEEKAALNELTEEIHNIREAWDWSGKYQQIQSLYRACTALWQLFELRRWFKEGEHTFWKTAQEIRAGQQAGQGGVEPEIVRAAMEAHRGCFLFRQGQSAAAYASLAPCVEDLRAAVQRTGADPLPLIYSLAYLGIVCWELGRLSEAVERLKEGVELCQRSDQPWYEAHLCEFLGIVSNDRGEYEQARQYLDRALAIFRRFGDQSYTAHTLSYFGRTLQAQGEYREAEKLLRESLKIAQEMDYRFGCGLALDALGQLSYAQGSYSEAQRCFQESASLFMDMGDTHRLARSLNHQGIAAFALHQDGEAHSDFAAALAMAQSGGLVPITNAAVAGLAALQARRESGQHVLEIVLALLQHPLTSQETRLLLHGLQQELENALPVSAVDAARHRAAEIDLNEAARWLLAAAER